MKKNFWCSEREDCNQCNHYDYCCEVPVKVLAWPLESWESMHLNKWLVNVKHGETIGEDLFADDGLILFLGKTGSMTFTTINLFF